MQGLDYIVCPAVKETFGVQTVCVNMVLFVTFICKRVFCTENDPAGKGILLEVL